MTNPGMRKLLAAFAILTVAGGCAVSTPETDPRGTVARSNDTATTPKKDPAIGSRVVKGMNYSNSGFVGLLIR